MPPFVLLSLVGPAIALHNNETLHGRVPRPLLRLPRPRARRRGAEGVRYYGPDGRLDPEVEALLEKPATRSCSPPSEVRERVLDRRWPRRPA